MIPTVLLAAVVGTQIFTQLPLQRALVNAVANFPDVQQAVQHVRENQALLTAARATALPQAQINYAQTPQGAANNSTVEQRLTTYGGSITLGDSLSYEPAVREAASAVHTAQFDLLDAQRTERAKTIGLYYTALRTIATERLRSQLLAQAQSDERTAQLRFKAGDAPKLDIIRTQVATGQAQADVMQAQVDVANAEDALAIETDLPVSVLSQLQPEPTTTADTTPDDPQQAVALALQRRGDVASARSAVDGEQAAVRIAESGIFPAVTVNAGYTNGVDSGVHVSGPSANVTASFPLSNANAARAEAERARLAQTQAKVESVRRQVTLEVASAARAYAASATALESAMRVRESAQRQLQATEIGYRNGASSSLDVADARRTYAQAALLELDAIYARAQSRATLMEAIGP